MELHIKIFSNSHYQSIFVILFLLFLKNYEKIGETSIVMGDGFGELVRRMGPTYVVRGC